MVGLHHRLLHAAHRSSQALVFELINSFDPTYNILVALVLLVFLGLNLYLGLVVNLDELVRNGQLRRLAHSVHVAAEAHQAVHHMARCKLVLQQRLGLAEACLWLLRVLGIRFRILLRD